jgi:hypothetical protein
MRSAERPFTRLQPRNVIKVARSRADVSTEMSRSTDKNPQQSELARIALLSCVAMASFTVSLTVGRLRHGFDQSHGYSMTMWLGFVDIFLAVALCCGAPSTYRRVRARTSAPLVDAGLLLVAALGVSSAIHPIDRGLAMVVRLAGAVVVADGIANANRQLLRTLGNIIGTLALVQWTLGVVQLIIGGPLGLWFLGERSNPLYPFGDANAPSGTFFHTYLWSGFQMTAMGIVATLAFRGILSKRLAVAVTAAAVSSAFLGYSRVSILSAGLFAVVVSVVGIAHRDQRRFAFRLIAIAGAVGALTFALTLKGWSVKAVIAEQSGVTSGRMQLMGENVDVFFDHPFVGVGTGRYTLSLLDQGKNLGETPRPPHNVALAALTEAGALALPALLANLVAIGLLIRRRHWVPLISIATVIPPLLLEQYMWNWAEGMLMVALGFGTASVGRSWREPKSVPEDRGHFAPEPEPEPIVTVSIS